MCIQGSPKWNLRRPKVPRRWKKEGQKLTFESPKRSLYVQNLREWPLAKTSAGAMFSSHYEGPGLSLFTPKLASGTHCAPGRFFSNFWISFWCPRATQGRQGRPKAFERTPKAFPGTRKIHEKSTWDLTLAFKKARVSFWLPSATQGRPRETKRYRK
jgi:hypothetical protein